MPKHDSKIPTRRVLSFNKRPEAFLKFESKAPIERALSFIIFANVSSEPPTCEAIVYAASFADSIIVPFIKSMALHIVFRE